MKLLGPIAIATAGVSSTRVERVPVLDRGQVGLGRGVPDLLEFPGPVFEFGFCRGVSSCGVVSRDGGICGGGIGRVVLGFEGEDGVELRGP